MPVPNFLLKLVWGGKFGALDEWSVGMFVNDPTDIGVPAADFLPALTAWHTAALAIPSSAKLDFIKYNGIDPLTGKYAVAGLSNTHIVAAPVSGPGGSTSPQQLAVVHSLRTLNSRGRGHAGRIYVPWAGITATDGRLSTTTAGTMAGVTKDLIVAVNALTGGQVVVFSKLAQTVTPVTHVGVGRVVDTQRRRRSSFVEELQLSATI